MSDREKIVEIILSRTSTTGPYIAEDIADRLIEAGFRLVNIRFSNESEVSEEGTIKLDQS